MQEAGISVPRVFAWGVERRLGILRRCFLVLDRIQGAVDLRRLQREDDDTARRWAVLRAVGESVRQMHAAAVCHRDLAGRNLLIVGWDEAGPPQVIFIDCPRAERGVEASQ